MSTEKKDEKKDGQAFFGIRMDPSGNTPTGKFILEDELEDHMRKGAALAKEACAHLCPPMKEGQRGNIVALSGDDPENSIVIIARDVELTNALGTYALRAAEVGYDYAVAGLMELNSQLATIARLKRKGRFENLENAVKEAAEEVIRVTEKMEKGTDEKGADEKGTDEKGTSDSHADPEFVLSRIVGSKDEILEALPPQMREAVSAFLDKVKNEDDGPVEGCTCHRCLPQ